MADYGVTPEGFNRKRLDILLEELNSEVKSIFGDDFNVSPESPDGQINGVVSESNANLWEIAELSYNAFNPSAVTGDGLSNLVQLNGIERLPATKSRVSLTLTGDEGTTIPEGSLVSSNSGDQFSTESEVVIGASGSNIVFASAIEFGPIIAVSGSVSSIDTPISGWLSVSNLEDAKLGTYKETDPQLRSRRERSVARDAQAIIDSIYAAVANLDNVTKVVVQENDTDFTDVKGLPPHSFRVVVIGGNDEEIAGVIWLKKPAGITSFGNTYTTILDSQSIPHLIYFSRPEEIEIYVVVDLTPFPDYPSDGDDLIKQAIVDYTSGNLIEGRGFSLGEQVVHSRLYTPVNSIVGHEIDSIKIGISPDPEDTDNIPINSDQISNFRVVNIVVNS
jgi:uncharacterized phage protein gp47/JayE